MDRTNAERQRRYIAKLKAAAARPSALDLEEQIAALKAELAHGLGSKPRTGTPRAEPTSDNTSTPELAQARAEIAALNQELAQAKARITELEQKLAQTEKRLHDLRIERVGLRFAPKPRTPKTAKPPLPPDEQRERIIKGLRTRVQHLTNQLHHMALVYAEENSKKGIMTLQTRRAIDKALHPDRKQLTEADREADRDNACKLWNAWKDDSGRARQRRS